MSEQWQGHSRPEDHRTTGKRAWNLLAGEWCYRDDWCEQCKRDEYGDPWEALERVRKVCDDEFGKTSDPTMNPVAFGYRRALKNVLAALDGGDEVNRITEGAE